MRRWVEKNFPQPYHYSENPSIMKAMYPIFYSQLMALIVIGLSIAFAPSFYQSVEISQQLLSLFRTRFLFFEIRYSQLEKFQLGYGYIYFLCFTYSVVVTPVVTTAYLFAFAANWRKATSYRTVGLPELRGAILAAAWPGLIAYITLAHEINLFSSPYIGMKQIFLGNSFIALSLAATTVYPFGFLSPLLFAVKAIHQIGK